MRNLEFKIELYLVIQIPENTEGYTWIGTVRSLDLFIYINYYVLKVLILVL